MFAIKVIGERDEWWGGSNIHTWVVGFDEAIRYETEAEAETQAEYLNQYRPCKVIDLRHPFERDKEKLREVREKIAADILNGARGNDAVVRRWEEVFGKPIPEVLLNRPKISFGIAIERIWPSDLVAIENGRVRRLTNDDIRKHKIVFPEGINDINWKIQQSDETPKVE